MKVGLALRNWRVVAYPQTRRGVGVSAQSNVPRLKVYPAHLAAVKHAARKFGGASCIAQAAGTVSSQARQGLRVETGPPRSSANFGPREKFTQPEQIGAAFWGICAGQVQGRDRRDPAQELSSIYEK